MKDLEARLRDVEVIVVGVDGNNGLRAEMKVMKSELKALFDQQNKFLGALLIISPVATSLLGVLFYAIIKP